MDAEKLKEELAGIWISYPYYVYIFIELKEKVGERSGCIIEKIER